MAEVFDHFDGIFDSFVEGWAIDLEDAERPIVLDLRIDDEIVGQVIADQYREDLEVQNIRDGYAKFRFKIPDRYFDGVAHTVSVIRRSDPSTHLNNSPQSFCFSSKELPQLKKKKEWAENDLVLYKSIRYEEIKSNIRKNGKIALLSTYHTLPRFLPYHLRLINNLRYVGFTVLVVHATEEMSSSLLEIDKEDTFLIVKRNVGYDFGSWAVGYYLLQDILDYVDEMVLINDSIVGPLKDFRTIFSKISQKSSSVVGLTDSFEKNYHLQSYFLWFDRDVVRSHDLASFFSNYSFSSNKDVIIEQGELGLSQTLSKAGYRLRAVYPYEEVASRWLKNVPKLISTIDQLPEAGRRGEFNEFQRAYYKEKLLQTLNDMLDRVINGEPLNPTHFFWDTLIEDFSFPFLKRELISKNPGAAPSYFRMGSVLSQASGSFVEVLADMLRQYGTVKMPFLDNRLSPNEPVRGGVLGRRLPAEA